MPGAGGRSCTGKILTNADRFPIEKAIAGTVPIAVSHDSCCLAPSLPWGFLILYSFDQSDIK